MQGSSPITLGHDFRFFYFYGWTLRNNHYGKAGKHHKKKNPCGGPGYRSRGGPQALTARSLSAVLGCGAGALFNSFGSIRGIRDAVKAEARRLYQLRVRAGFSLNPPSKGFGMAFLWFAMDEPQVSEILGKNARAFLMVIRAGADDRE